MSRRTFGYVRHRGVAKWQALYHLEGHRYSLGMFPSKGAASAALAQVQSQILERRWLDPEKGTISFRLYSSEWLASRPHLRPRTRDVYKSLLTRHITPVFGESRLARVTPEAVRRWYTALSQRHPSTARAAYRLLRAILATAVEDGRIAHNPCRIKGAGSDRADERQVPNPQDVEKLVLALPEKLRMTAMLAAGAGLRRGEVLGLQRRDIDLDHDLVHVRRALHEPSDGKLDYGPTKNGESRILHMSPEVAEELRSHMERFVSEEQSAPLFTGRTGERLRPSSLGYSWRKARKSCGGLTYIRFHDLRHFHATVYSAHGASLREVMARGGWKSPSMVARYQHATPERDAELASKLPPLLSNTDSAPTDDGDGGSEERDSDGGAEEH